MTLIAAFEALAGAIKAVPIIDSWFRMLIAAWMQGQEQKTLSLIVDAASMARRAKTDEERYVAADMWRVALSRPRVMD